MQHKYCCTRLNESKEISTVVILIILEFPAGIQSYLKNEVRKFYPHVGQNDEGGCCAFNSPYSCVNMARTLAIVKLLTDKISYAAHVLRKYKHSFQRRDPGVCGAVGSQCDYNLAEIPKTMFRDWFL